MLAATMRFTSPAKNTVLTITDKPEWPALKFTTDATGAHTWRWTIASSCRTGVPRMRARRSPSKTCFACEAG